MQIMQSFNSFQELHIAQNNIDGVTDAFVYDVANTENNYTDVTDTVESIDNELQYAGGVEASGSHADIAVNALLGCDSEIDTLIGRLNNPNYTQEQIDATKRQITRRLGDISAHVTKAKTEIADKKASDNQAKANYAIKQETQINDLLTKIKPKLKKVGLSR